MSYRFKITINCTKVMGTNTNFVYLFSDGRTGIPSGFWSYVADTTNGIDIRYFDTDDITELKREVVLYSTGTQKAEAWVQIPLLKIVSNKVIWCQYGDGSVTNSNAVWTDINATGIYHYQNTANDSSGTNNLNITGTTQVDTGKIHEAYDFSGNDYMSVTKAMHSDQYTLSRWVYVTGVAPNTRYDTREWKGTYSGDTYASQKDSWHRMVATYDGYKFRRYINGELKNMSASFDMPACGTAVLVDQYSSSF